MKPEKMREYAKGIAVTIPSPTDEPVATMVAASVAAQWSIASEICERLDTLIEQNRAWSESWHKTTKRPRIPGEDR